MSKYTFLLVLFDGYYQHSELQADSKYTTCRTLVGHTNMALSTWLSVEVGSYTMSGMVGLHKDVDFLEQWADQISIPGMSHSSMNLKGALAELRQMVNLVLSCDLDVLFTPAGQAEVYPILMMNPARLISFLDKFRDSSDARLKRKQIDVVLKRLKEKKKTTRRGGMANFAGLQ